MSVAGKQFNFSPIGIVHSPYKQKFAIPRQPGLVSAAHGHIELTLTGNQHELFRDIEQHSHIWVIFVFHATKDNGWKPLVKAPRLGGNKKTGVFATRSTFRPNPIGMSVVKNEGVVKISGKWCLKISGLDLLDATPVLDIKPYIPYSDSLVHAHSNLATAPQEHDIQVGFSKQALLQLNEFNHEYPNLKQFIVQVLEQDPRPAYKKTLAATQEYGMSLYDLNIRWQTQGQQTTVLIVEKAEQQPQTI